MAEANVSQDPVWKSNVLCRYFVHGVCLAGQKCPYSHNIGDKPDNVCRYYLKGSCNFGTRCRFDHVRPPLPLMPQNHVKRPASSNNNTPHACSPSKSASISNTQDRNFHMVKLTKPGSVPKESVLSPNAKPPEEWIKAFEFVPGQKWQGAGPVSYLAAAKTGVSETGVSLTSGDQCGTSPSDTTCELCPYGANGECRFGEDCTYMHGEICDMCGKSVLQPGDHEQNERHRKECEKFLEEDMELSFAVQRSKDKSCGICMDVVWDKNPPTERRFGILSGCNHVFCLTCIRKWRAAKNFANKIVRSCPECRVKSDFITPSKYWAEDKEEKIRLIEGYKVALSKKKCKYFDEGRGECPFNANCFYRHAYPDGKIASPKPVRRRRRENADGEIDLISQIILWDFMEERNLRRVAFDFDDMDLDDLIFQLNFADSSDDDSDDDFGLFPY